MGSAGSLKGGLGGLSSSATLGVAVQVRKEKTPGLKSSVSAESALASGKDRASGACSGVRGKALRFRSLDASDIKQARRDVFS